jgi:sporulation protein YlmC with PRC-barrel domain
MRKFMLSTAVLAAPAFAQASSTFHTAPGAGQMEASAIMGATLYAAPMPPAGDTAEGVQDGRESVGSVGDIVLTREGRVAALLVDVGGFLGIGGREVAVDMGAVRIVADASTPDDPEDFFLVVTADRTMFEEAAEWTRGDSAALASAAPAMPSAGAADMAAADPVPTASAPEAPAAAPLAPAAPMIDREGYAAAEAGTLTAEMLTGASAYDLEDARVGRVSDLVLTDDGRVTHVVVDVGGFLGMGAHSVALDLEEVTILRADDGSTVRIYVPQTPEDLRSRPAFQS